MPTIRGDSIARFLELWREQFDGHRVIVVEDNPDKTFDLPPHVEHYSWRDVDLDLGPDAWIIPRRTDCIRSYGFYKANLSEPEIVITLDDDCYPIEGTSLVDEHVQALSSRAESDAWVATGAGTRTRGMPYLSTRRNNVTAINHGLWEGVVDLDAMTALAMSPGEVDFQPVEQVVPRGSYFPMCGMNLAFSGAATPIMYFLLMGQSWPFDRFGDIWCGVIAKRICDHLGWAVRSGRPFVHHARASNVWSNLRKESPGYEVNESFWLAVDEIQLTGTTAQGCYKEIAQQLPLKGDYWEALRRAMVTWSNLFA
ncbi:MAG TPA: hypothetical protein VNE62_07790 [Actinomycetota bacterium]|nr:hypothetical protein [Actinomycetota bacterium]